MVSLPAQSYGYMWEVARHKRRVEESHKVTAKCNSSFLSAQQLSKCIRNSNKKLNQLLYNFDFILVSLKPIESLQSRISMHSLQHQFVLIRLCRPGMMQSTGLKLHDFANHVMVKFSKTLHPTGQELRNSNNSLNCYHFQNHQSYKKNMNVRAMEIINMTRFQPVLETVPAPAHALPLLMHVVPTRNNREHF